MWPKKAPLKRLLYRWRAADMPAVAVGGILLVNYPVLCLQFLAPAAAVPRGLGSWHGIDTRIVVFFLKKKQDTRIRNRRL
jgi:hypothetical protein